MTMTYKDSNVVRATAFDIDCGGLCECQRYESNKPFIRAKSVTVFCEVLGCFPELHRKHLLPLSMQI